MSANLSYLPQDHGRRHMAKSIWPPLRQRRVLLLDETLVLFQVVLPSLPHWWRCRCRLSQLILFVWGRWGWRRWFTWIGCWLTIKFVPRSPMSHLTSSWAVYVSMAPSTILQLAMFTYIKHLLTIITPFFFGCIPHIFCFTSHPLHFTCLLMTKFVCSPGCFEVTLRRFTNRPRSLIDDNRLLRWTEVHTKIADHSSGLQFLAYYARVLFPNHIGNQIRLHVVFDYSVLSWEIPQAC